MSIFEVEAEVYESDSCDGIYGNYTRIYDEGFVGGDCTLNELDHTAEEALD